MQTSYPTTKPDLRAAEIAQYVTLKWPVFPCIPSGKRPATERGFHDATLDAGQVLTFFAGRQNNVGVPTGSVSGGWVLDIDPDKGGTESFAQLSEGIELPPTPIARTGRGGLHYWFAMPDGPVKCAVGLMPGIDIRGDGGYVVVPPSTLPEGAYEWLVAPWDVPLATCPAELLERLEAAHKNRKPDGDPSSSTVGRGFDIERALQGAPEGARDATLFQLACRLRADNVGMDSAIAMLEMAARNCNPPFDARIARQKVEWVWRRYAAGYSDDVKDAIAGNVPNPTSDLALVNTAHANRVTVTTDEDDQPKPIRTSMTDLGNALRLVERIKGRAHWCHAWKSWMLWDGSRWKRDETGGAPILREACSMVRGMLSESLEQTAADLAWARKSNMKREITSMIELAKAQDGIPITPDELDRNHWLLNVPNGTLDLRTGELRPHSKADLITRLAGAPYNPEANIELLASFLDTITRGSRDLQRFLCKAAGYSLTGSLSEQCLFFLYGSGRNGKSTFIDAIMHAMGEYSMHTPTETLMVKRDNPGVPNDLARLKGARLVAATETEAGKRLAESLVKQLTGGDPITARFLHAEYFTYTPTFKLWISGNYKPAIRGADEGIWRRMRLVPMDVRIPDSDVDKDLPAKLQADAEAILAWMVAGTGAWLESRLVTPDEVMEATGAYRTEMDTIGQFIDDCVQGASGGAFLASGQVYKAYRTWCEEHGEHARSAKMLSQEMVARGFTLGKLPGGLRGFKGLKLTDGTGDGSGRRMPHAD